MLNRPFTGLGRAMTAIAIFQIWAALAAGSLTAQTWVERRYNSTDIRDVAYRIATDFAGQQRTLLLDVSLPTGDAPPVCGRPLMVFVHGGGWMAGSRTDANALLLRQRFAARGYVAISINYRLGMFHTDAARNCNVPGWNCWNIADTAEYLRANYRGVQDLHAALVFAQAQSNWQVDSNHVFLIGESAGAFVTLALSYLDHPEEMSAATAALPDAARPNRLYEPLCIQATGLARDVDAMQLQRPDLGSPGYPWATEGQRPYRLRAQASIYGAMFGDLFDRHRPDAPDLWMYHQPCDLIVPFQQATLLQGYNQCAQGFPSNCAPLSARPQVIGSGAIAALIDRYRSLGRSMPVVQTFFSNNQASCLEQILNPAVGCHQMQSFDAVDASIAAFFAARITGCGSSVREALAQEWSVYPSVLRRSASVQVRVDELLGGGMLTIVDASGRLMDRIDWQGQPLSLEGYPAGMYSLRLQTADGYYAPRRIIVLDAD